MSNGPEWMASIDQRFLQQEDALRELNDRLEQRRRDLNEKTDLIIKGPGACATKEESEFIIHKIGTTPETIPFINEDEGEEFAIESESNVVDVAEESLQRLELEHHVLGLKGMSSDSKEKLLLAKLTSAEKQIERLKQECHENLTSAENSRAELKAAQDQIKALNRQYKQAESKAEKTEAALSKTEDGSRDLSRELSETKRELEIAKKIAKDLEKSNKAKDTKLNRALAETARFKSLADEKQTSSQSQDAAWRQDKASLESEISNLKRTKSDLLTIVKKQFKLIDILKRQKMHVEAARLLAFTEEQFSNHIQHNK